MTQLRGQQATSRSSLESITRAGQATQYPLGPEADLHKIGVGGSNGTGGQYKISITHEHGEIRFITVLHILFQRSETAVGDVVRN